MKPIIFSGDMVRALLDGSKTQTRRVVKDCKAFQDWDAAPSDAYDACLAENRSGGAFLVCGDHGYTAFVPCPYGRPGQLLWVRETFACVRRDSFDAAWTGLLSEMPPEHEIVYRASDADIIPPGVWRSPIHMPRWASRLTLRLTDVRVQRVQDISRGDAIAEGMTRDFDERGWLNLNSAVGGPLREYERIWDSINAKRGYGWDTNPWVWALTFDVLQVNVQDIA